MIGGGRFALTASVLPLLMASGCASLGGNVKGSFSCAAPDGVCAPSLSIDDRALAMISGDAGDMIVSASSPHTTPQGRETIRTGPPDARSASSHPSIYSSERTGEKVLRIVFLPHIDERGHLHEASALHAVVGRSEWRSQAILDATVLPDASKEPVPEIVQAIGAAGTESDDMPRPPDPEAVAAARARRSDPMAAIKAEVGKRLGSGPLVASPSQRIAKSQDKLISPPTASTQSGDAPSAASMDGAKAGTFPAVVPEER